MKSDMFISRTSKNYIANTLRFLIKKIFSRLKNEKITVFTQ